MASTSAEPRLGGSRSKGPSSPPHKAVDRQVSKSGQQSQPVGESSVAGDGSRRGPISRPLREGRSRGRSQVRAPNKGAPSKPASSLRPPQARSWVNVARLATKGYGLSYIPPAAVVGEKAVVNLSGEVLQAANPKWKEFLVGYFIGRKLPFQMIEQTLKNIWGTKLVDMLANDQEFYYFHIPDPKFRRKILEEGPITVARIPLILQQWKPLMELKKAKQTFVPVWIRLKNLPLDLWSAPAISVIASSVGKPLHVDQRTEGTRMISFARVCVEIQANRPRVSTVEVNVDGVTRSIAVNYEWRPLKCSKCGVFGHKCDVAPPLVRPLPAHPLDQPAETPEDSEQGWKQVKSKKNKAQPLEGMLPSPSEGERSLNLKTMAVEKGLPGTYSRRPPREPLIISE
ncbi:hypothetical protein ACJRO7_019979 [Eucalyptus globulus]|uniref:DUF4283 domain-containing protein n=1 Tax=Eucalyptus globulus TaxID=34317 RepID=A0ABD3KFT6_EUCGL